MGDFHGYFDLKSKMVVQQKEVSSFKDFSFFGGLKKKCLFGGSEIQPSTWDINEPPGRFSKPQPGISTKQLGKLDL